MTTPDFTLIGSFQTQGISDIPPSLTYPTLKIEFEGNFSLSNWIPAGRLYRLADLGDDKPSIVGSWVLYLQQPNLVVWSGLDLTYTLKFEPSQFLKATPLKMKIWGSNAAPATGGSSGPIDPETVRDIVGAMLMDTSSIASTYNDSENLIQLDAIFGSAAGEICEGNDPRLGDSRDPNPGSVNNLSVADDAAISWTKISKSGAAPADVGAAAATHNHIPSSITDLVEYVQDLVASFISEGPGMTKAYDDVNGILYLDADTTSGYVSSWEDLILNSSAWEASLS